MYALLSLNVMKKQCVLFQTSNYEIMFAIGHLNH